MPGDIYIDVYKICLSEKITQNNNNFNKNEYNNIDKSEKITYNSY